VVTQIANFNYTYHDANALASTINVCTILLESHNNILLAYEHIAKCTEPQPLKLHLYACGIII